MARAKKKPAAAAPRGAAGGRAPARAQSRKAPAPAAATVEVVEEEKGMGFEDGIVLFTTVALVAGIILVEIALQRFYGAGVFG